MNIGRLLLLTLVVALFHLPNGANAYAQESSGSSGGLGIGNWFTVSANLDAGYRRTQVLRTALQHRSVPMGEPRRDLASPISGQVLLGAVLSPGGDRRLQERLVSECLVGRPWVWVGGLSLQFLALSRSGQPIR